MGTRPNGFHSDVSAPSFVTQPTCSTEKETIFLMLNDWKLGGAGPTMKYIATPRKSTQWRLSDFPSLVPVKPVKHSISSSFSDGRLKSWSARFPLYFSSSTSFRRYSVGLWSPGHFRAVGLVLTRTGRGFAGRCNQQSPFIGFLPPSSAVRCCQP